MLCIRSISPLFPKLCQKQGVELAGQGVTLGSSCVATKRIVVKRGKMAEGQWKTQHGWLSRRRKRLGAPGSRWPWEAGENHCSAHMKTSYWFWEVEEDFKPLSGTKMGSNQTAWETTQSEPVPVPADEHQLCMIIWLWNTPSNWCIYTLPYIKEIASGNLL